MTLAQIRFTSFVLIMGAILFLNGSWTMARQLPQDIVQQANTLRDTTSWKKALELYQKALTDPKLPRCDEIELRVLIALIRTERWQEAVDATDALLRKTAGTLMEAPLLCKSKQAGMPGQKNKTKPQRA